MVSKTVFVHFYMLYLITMANFALREPAVKENNIMKTLFVPESHVVVTRK